MEFRDSDGFELQKGQKQYVSLKIGEYPNGYPVRMPIMAVSGVEDGPTLFINACMHGDEILGSDVVRRIVHDLSPETLRGNLVTVPMANPSGAATRTRRNIVEMYPGPHDMNRVFPSNGDGVMTERTAALLQQQFIAPADYAFDVHCASVGGLWHPYSTIPSKETCSSERVYDESVGLARAFGAPNLLAGSLFHGSLLGFGVSNGTPTSMAEFGVANLIDDENRAFGMRGLSNLLKHLDMIEGEPEVPSDQVVLSEVHRLRTDVAGFLLIDVEIGADVKAGDRVAHIDDMAGSTKAIFEAPVDGRVCRINTMGVVGTGDIVAYVATTQ